MVVVVVVVVVVLVVLVVVVCCVVLLCVVCCVLCVVCCVLCVVCCVLCVVWEMLSSGSFVDAAESTHSSAVEWNVVLSFSLSLYMFLAWFDALHRAHRCCLSISSWDRSSNFVV